METYNDCLLNVPVFVDLDRETLVAISALIEPKHYKANEVVYHDDELVDALGVLHVGSVKLSKTNIEGKERIVSVLLPGDYFGETSLLTSQNAQYDIVALEDTWICTIDVEKFRALMKTNQDMMLTMLQSMIDRVSDRENVVLEQSLIPANERVYDALSHYTDDKARVSLPISKKDLANSLGITPETFSRCLSKLEKDGKILRKGQEIFIV